MKVENAADLYKVKFGSLMRGEPFICNGVLYMKTEQGKVSLQWSETPINSVNLVTGGLRDFNIDTLVTKVEAKVVIEKEV